MSASRFLTTLTVAPRVSTLSVADERWAASPEGRGQAGSQSSSGIGYSGVMVEERIVELREVDAENWRACAALKVEDGQRDFVMPVSHYLALCHYGGAWHPLAVYREDRVVGFVMWAIDPADRSGWLGGLTIDRRHQGRGYGSAAVRAVLRKLRDDQGCPAAALSCSSANSGARDVYASLGFEETGELEDDELVARRPL